MMVGDFVFLIRDRCRYASIVSCEVRRSLGDDWVVKRWESV